MARNGQKIFDTDTHVGPSMDLLEKYMSAEDKARLEPLSAYRVAVTKPTNAIVYQMGGRQYRRKLGTDGVTAAPAVTSTLNTSTSGLTESFKGQAPNPDVDLDPAFRIADLDVEGVDVNLMLPGGWLGSFTSIPDVALETAVFSAFHRWMNDYCSAYPDRLGGVVALSCRDVEWSLRELERCGKERWAWGVLPYAPAGMPLDHPDLEPLWAAAQDLDLSVCLHTFTTYPPYAPGGQDTWDNIWIQRSAAHVWCGERNMAALIGAGLFDRYPTLRIGVLEGGHGWLPQWALRLDEQAERSRTMLPDLKLKPSEYVQSGRYFQSMEISEGWPMTKAVVDLVGDGILMYASDYPHGESWFPRSVETVMDWKMPATLADKVFWENPIRFYPRAGYDS